MIDLETHVLLRHYLEQGVPKAAIARKLGLSERTIRRWIQAGLLERALDEPPRYKPRPPVPCKLDPYKAVILTRLQAYPELSAVRLLEEIRTDGYTGGYSQLRDFVRQVRPRAAQLPVRRFETPAGHQAQADFAEFDLPFGKRHALVVVLGYSRLLWLAFYRRQDMATLFAGLEAAFQYFGGVPHEVLFDQMKTVVTGDLRLKGGQLILNEEFLRYAEHWAFRPRACRPYRAQTKGKVERPIRYVRENFAYGRDFLNQAHLDEELARWLERANSRRHATTKEAPRLRFERDERARLLPLAEASYRSLVLAPAAAASEPIGLPRILVEKRPLSAYAALVEP